MSQTTLHDAIRRAADPLATMNRIVEQAIDLLPAADGASLEVLTGPDELEYLCTAGTLSDFVGLRLRVATSLSGRSLVTREVLRCDDSAVDPRVDHAASRRVGAVSMLCVPLTGADGNDAVLKVTSRLRDAFTDHDAATLQRLAGFLSAVSSAASEVARVTADVLDSVDEDTSDSARASARFVANVMSPGLNALHEADSRIARVIEHGDITMVVQPLFELATGRLVSVEALARFHDLPDRAPDLWFAEAAAVGRGADLELLAVERALPLLDDLPRSVSLHVNVGPDAICSGRLPGLVAACDARRVIVEVTEHESLRDRAVLEERLCDIRRTGVRLALDDTGTGYAGLSELLRIRPDVVKLDRDLVTDVDTDPARQALVVAMVRFAADIAAVIVAEGIETETEARTLLDLGVQLGQGWFLGRPVPVADLVTIAPWP